MTTCCAWVFTSEVFDLKPTSEYRGVGVEFVDGDHPGATRRARHTGSGVSGPSVSERLYWQTGHRAGPSVLHAGAVGQAGCFARCTGADFGEVPGSGKGAGGTGRDSGLSVSAQRESV